VAAELQEDTRPNSLLLLFLRNVFIFYGMSRNKLVDEGVHNVLKEKVGVRIASPFLGDALFFAASFAVVCHANLRHPELVRDSYRALLLRFFDTDERHKFF